MKRYHTGCSGTTADTYQGLQALKQVMLTQTTLQRHHRELKTALTKAGTTHTDRCASRSTAAQQGTGTQYFWHRSQVHQGEVWKGVVTGQCRRRQPLTEEHW